MIGWLARGKKCKCYLRYCPWRREGNCNRELICRNFQTARSYPEPLALIGVLLILLFVFCAIFGPLGRPRAIPPSSISPTASSRRTSQHLFWHRRARARHPLPHTLRRAYLHDCRHFVVAGSLSSRHPCRSLRIYGGRLDRFINVIVMNAFLSFPGILLAIAFVAFLGPGRCRTSSSPLSLEDGSATPALCAQVLAAREREYVEAARALGAGDWRILSSHSAQHHAAGDCSGRHRHGRSDPGRRDDELPWTRRPASGAELGSHVERSRVPTVFDFSPRSSFSRRRGHARRILA